MDQGPVKLLGDGGDASSTELDQLEFFDTLLWKAKNKLWHLILQQSKVKGGLIQSNILYYNYITLYYSYD